METQIAVCAVAKNEDRYIKEWVSYYLTLGVNHIYLYDNNNVATPTIESIKSDYVTVIPVHGYNALQQLGFQTGVYTNCYKTYGHLYDWMGFFDIDEFFTLNAYDSLSDYFQCDSFTQANIIHVNWRYYGDNDLIVYDNRPVRERFLQPAPDNVRYAQQFPENNHVKSWVRCGQPFVEINAHTGWFDGVVCVHTDGSRSDAHSCFHPYSWKTAQVSHYGTKTIDEYIQRRIYCTTRGTGAKQIAPEQRIKWFFNVNQPTKQKTLIAEFVLNQLKRN